EIIIALLRCRSLRAHAVRLTGDHADALAILIENRAARKAAANSGRNQEKLSFCENIERCGCDFPFHRSETTRYHGLLRCNRNVEVRDIGIPQGHYVT